MCDKMIMIQRPKQPLLLEHHQVVDLQACWCDPSFMWRHPDLRDKIMFTKAGLIELHSTAHERLNLLMAHIATLRNELWHQPIPGFGHPSIWKQLVHIL